MNPLSCFYTLLYVIIYASICLGCLIWIAWSHQKVCYFKCERYFMFLYVFICCHMLSYAFIRSYILLYAFIWFNILSYAFIPLHTLKNASICFYTLLKAFICLHILNCINLIPPKKFDGLINWSVLNLLYDAVNIMGLCFNTLLTLKRAHSFAQSHTIQLFAWGCMLLFVWAIYIYVA